MAAFATNGNRLSGNGLIDGSAIRFSGFPKPRGTKFKSRISWANIQPSVSFAASLFSCNQRSSSPPVSRKSALPWPPCWLPLFGLLHPCCVCSSVGVLRFAWSRGPCVHRRISLATSFSIPSYSIQWTTPLSDSPVRRNCRDIKLASDGGILNL
jgi:hypothetical protein